MSKVLNKAKDSFFSKIHGNNLIYNACWEDPRCDHEIMQINAESKIVVITSAGCNALDYLLKAPKAVHCIDVNPRQNATLELKLALAKLSDHQTLFAFFGTGYHPNAAGVLHNLKPELSDFAYNFWKEKIKYFSTEKKSFYYRGTSGKFALLFRKYLKSKGVYKWALAMVNAQTLDEQRINFKKIEKVVFSGFIKWMMNRHITMSMLGVPRPQRQLLLDGHEGGIAGFLYEALKHVFVELDIKDNYFWRAYISGTYTENCCPEYLKKENFEKLKELANGIDINTCTITDFLKQKPDAYTHFVLLDHQDWLAAHNETALNEEWEYIIKNAAPNAITIMRSAAPEIDFIPQVAKDAFLFTNENIIHQKCRVGTYSSTHVGRKI